MTSIKFRLAVTSADHDGLEGRVGGHFGRCPAFTLVDVEEGRIDSTRVVENPFIHGHAPGEVPEFIAGQQAAVLLTGGIGHRAIAFFDQHGIQVSSGHEGTVVEAVEAWMKGLAGGPESCGGHHEHGDGDPSGRGHQHGHEGCGRNG